MKRNRFVSSRDESPHERRTPRSPPTTRPRVEGERELEILEATLEVLGDVGYDRLTMDAVATRAKASKATLYRRWNGKASARRRRDLSQKGPTDRARHRQPAR